MSTFCDTSHNLCKFTVLTCYCVYSMFQGGRFRSNDRGIGGEFHQACQRMVGAEKVRCYAWRVLGVKLSYLYLLFQDLVTSYT